MLTKLITLTVLMVCVGAGVLLIRQHRLQTAHQAAELHLKVQNMRQKVWAAQMRSSLLLSPEQLRRRIEQAGLELEPAVPTKASTVRSPVRAVPAAARRH